MSSLLRDVIELLCRPLQVVIARLLDTILARGGWRRFPWLIVAYRLTARYCNRLSFKEVKRLLMIDAEHSIRSLSVTATGVLQCFCADRLFMIPGGDVSAHSLAQSHQNWQALRAGGWPTLAGYEFECHHADTVYSMELLASPASSQEAVTILSQIADSRKGALQAFEWQPLIDRLARFFCMDAFEVVQRCEQRVAFGLLHGDFHVGNIMRSKQGDLVLIDLDRLCSRAPQFIDHLNFKVYQREQELARSWLSVIATGDIDLEGYSREQWLAYILFRSAAEVSSYTPGIRYRKRFKSAVSAIDTMFDTTVAE
ncbi:phosphotransferase [Pseudomonas putida]|uniref:phosphotransferase n=1 Tax=Pseudomonas TaxID=286 RepID=UPI0034654ADE